MEPQYFSDMMNSAGLSVKNKRYEDAATIYEKLIKEVEELEEFKDREEKKMYAFEDTFEEILFKYYAGDNKMEIQRARFPLAMMYVEYAALLYNMRKPKEALEALMKAKSWNPASMNVYFELMEVYKATDNKEEYYKCAKEAFKYAYKSAQLGKCYRNLGIYYTEVQEYDLSVACLSMSLGYDRSANTMIMSELNYIEKILGQKPKKPELEYVKELFAKNDVPFGPYKDVIGMASAYAKALMSTKETGAQKYFLGIVFDLTGDEKVGELLKGL